MKLAVASGIFHPEAGGPATYLYHLLPELQQRGWQVRLITYSDAHPTAQYPYPVTRIPRRALPVRLLHYGAAAWPLLRWGDVTYVHSLDLPLLAARGPRVVKIVGDPAWERAIRKSWIPPDEDIDTFQHKSYSRIVSAQQAARSRQVRGMDGVIVPSEYLKRMVLGWGVPEEKIHVIYNAIHQPETRAITREEARQRLALDDAPMLLTIARLTAWKGVDHLIRAMREIPDARLLIAGDGPDYDRLAALARALHVEQRVVFLGRVPRDRVALCIRAADYVALYSGYEGLSHTLLESLCLGTPVIASDKGGNPEVVQHGINGLLVPYINQEALAETVRAALQPGQREHLAANVQCGLGRFDFAQMVTRTAAVLQSYCR